MKFFTGFIKEVIASLTYISNFNISERLSVSYAKANQHWFVIIGITALL